MVKITTNAKEAISLFIFNPLRSKGIKSNFFKGFFQYLYLHWRKQLRQQAKEATSLCDSKTKENYIFYLKTS